MILTLEDFAVIFVLLTPVYALAYANLITIAKIDIRLSQSEVLFSELKRSHNYNHNIKY